MLQPRHATLRTLYDPKSVPTNPQILDPNALVLFFPGPKTATGEDVLELHVHGGAAVVKAVLGAIPKSLTLSQDNASALRYAEPGEFTRRAFYNDRLDLTQIEALGDALMADTEQQRRLAVRGAANTLSREYETWRQKLLYARGELEALIDFSEDQHFDESPGRLLQSVAVQVERLRKELQTSIQNSFRGELLRNGLGVALVGAPNAGKSSLLNRIVQREASIVSNEAGTTRDIVEVGVDIGGFYCRFGDLAGLRKSSRGGKDVVGEIEMEGMKRARTHTVTADVIVLVLSIEEVTAPGTLFINAEMDETLKACDLERQRVVCVINKSDLRTHLPLNEVCSKVRWHSAFSRLPAQIELPIFVVSCKEAELRTENPDSGGIQSLLQGLTDVFQGMTSAILPPGQAGLADTSIWELSLGATQRQRVLLEQCLQYIKSFLVEARFEKSNPDQLSADERESDVVLAAESLRSAADCLAKITGKGEAGDVEEVLGVVFER